MTTTPDPHSDAARLQAHRDAHRTVHPDISAGTRQALGNCQNHLITAISHVAALLDTTAPAARLLKVRRDARVWLHQIGATHLGHPEHYDLGGLRFKVVHATLSAADANAFMFENPTAALLAITPEGLHILADSEDLGEPIPTTDTTTEKP